MCRPCVGHVSALCPLVSTLTPLWPRLQTLSAMCPPCVSHVPLCPPCEHSYVRLVFALSPLWPHLQTLPAMCPPCLRPASGLVSTWAAPPSLVCHVSALPFVHHVSTKALPLDFVRSWPAVGGGPWHHLAFRTIAQLTAFILHYAGPIFFRSGTGRLRPANFAIKSV